MSTKIHEGLRIDLPEGQSVFDLANQLRTIISEEIHKESIRYNAGLIRKRLLTAEAGSSYLDHLVRVLRKDEDEWGTYDIGFFLYEPDHKEFLLAIPFGRGSAHYKRALEVPGVSEWGYWDNTDRPDELTEQQWEQRRNDWQVVDYGPAVETALTVKMSDMTTKLTGAIFFYTDEDWEDLAEAVFANPKDLARKAAVDTAWAAACKDLEVVEKVKDNPMRATELCKQLAHALVDENPDTVIIPDYVPEHLRTEEPLPLIEVNFPERWVNDLITDIKSI